jgi:ketosteroid isomerase-like protein
VLDRFEQIRMTDVEYTVGTEGGRVFVTSRGDYRQGDGTACKNVYVFRFVLRGGLIVSVDEYANPVTYAKLAGLPIG